MGSITFGNGYSSSLTCIPGTRRLAPGALYPPPYTLHPIPSTLYPIPHTLYPIPCFLCPGQILSEALQKLTYNLEWIGDS
ncbi:MAG: hypothetical protein DRG37_02405 [Deltaproteobacteria bacterium]|nr:MAG: hypothetical protein DRG37_02405 [Deltaproteobacteria bacterium]